MKPNLFQFIPGIIWVLLIFILLILPGSDIPTVDFFEIIYFDKWVHIGLFAVLTILWGYPFLKSKLLPVTTIVFVAVIAIVYGIIMEFVQKYFAASRSFDITDIFADSAGAVIGILVLIKIRKHLIKG